MFYRRKVILALLQAFDGQLEKIRLQKLLFLFTRQQFKSVYDFIPYKYGCFSYSANADMTTMVKKSILNESRENFTLIDKSDFIQQLNPVDRKILDDTKKCYESMSSATLMKNTYLNFPFYAINSEAAENLLNPLELKTVDNARPVIHKTVLFTIGYEGISLEEYFVRLIKNDVKVLVDVRSNPLSMKYGFNKSQLRRIAENLGMSYVHFPELGIQSEERRDLHDQDDYDLLFTKYREGNLKQTIKLQEQILKMLIKHRRIALTCFEANISQCHRKYLAEAIEKLPSFRYEVQHL